MDKKPKMEEKKENGKPMAKTPEQPTLAEKEEEEDGFEATPIASVPLSASSRASSVIGSGRRRLPNFSGTPVPKSSFRTPLRSRRPVKTGAIVEVERGPAVAEAAKEILEEEKEETEEPPQKKNKEEDAKKVPKEDAEKEEDAEKIEKGVPEKKQKKEKGKKAKK